MGEGHPAARIPGTDRFINMGHLHPRGAGMGGVNTPEDLVVLDLNLKKISGKYEHMNEAMIHAAIFKARPDVGAVIYSHPRYCNAFASLAMPIPSYGEGIPIWDSDGAIVDERRGSGLVKALGQSNAILLRNPHSLVVCAADVKDAMALVYYIEVKARKDYLSLMLGKIMGGDNFSFKPEHYGKQMETDPRIEYEHLLISVDDFGIEVEHSDLWRFLHEKNIAPGLTTK